jgi:hypothetical protein
MKIIFSYFGIGLTPRAMQTGSRGLRPPPTTLARSPCFEGVIKPPTFPALARPNDRLARSQAKILGGGRRVTGVSLYPPNGFSRRNG